MAVSKFQKQFRGSQSVYKCRLCHRMTRETGGEESSVELCYECNEWSMNENAILDGHYEGNPEGQAECETVILRLKLAAAAKGGSRSRLGLPAV